MSRAWRAAAVAQRRLGSSGVSARAVRSWFTRQSAALPSATVDACAVGPSADAQTVAAEAGPAPAPTTARRMRGSAPLTDQVRICRVYRVALYPALASGRMYYEPGTPSCLPALSEEELANRRVQLVRPLDLRDVATVQRHMRRLWHGLAHMPLECGGHEWIAAAPHEQRRRLEVAQPVPEDLRPLEIDVARCGVEGSASARGRVRAQELVDPSRRVARVTARDKLLDDPLDDRARCRLEQPKLRSQQAQPRRPRSLAEPRQRRRHQNC